MVNWFERRGVTVECVQTDNGFEFTNRFSNSKKDLPTRFELAAQRMGVRHKLIRPHTPRHNGKVERSHREDQKRLSTTRKESTPYIDKSQTLITYRAILSYGNLISLLTYNEDNLAKSEVHTDRLLWGDIIEILKHLPAGSGLDRIREVVLASDQAWQLS